MTDLKEHIDILRAAVRPSGTLNFMSAIRALDAIEAALFPKPGLQQDITNIVDAINESAAKDAKPDPTKQFVVGERYRSGHGIDYTCLFVFPDGSMGYMNTTVSSASMPFYQGQWTHVPHNPALEAAKVEHEAAAARLAELDAQIKELEGGA